MFEKNHFHNNIQIKESNMPKQAKLASFFGKSPKQSDKKESKKATGNNNSEKPNKRSDCESESENNLNSNNNNNNNSNGNIYTPSKKSKISNDEKEDGTVTNNNKMKEKEPAEQTQQTEQTGMLKHMGDDWSKVYIYRIYYLFIHVYMHLMQVSYVCMHVGDFNSLSAVHLHTNTINI